MGTIKIVVGKKVELVEKEISLPAYFKSNFTYRYIMVHSPEKCIVVQENSISNGSTSVWVDDNVEEISADEFFKQYNDVFEYLTDIVIKSQK